MNATSNDEDDAIAGAAATSVLASGITFIIAYENRSSIPREPYTNKDQANVGKTVEQAHPTHDKIINKKIDTFEEMSLVCGNDRARGDCAKSFYDISLDGSLERGNDNDIEGLSNDVVSETSKVKTSRKRSRSSDVQDVVGDVSTKLGEVAAPISKMTDSAKLYEEIMAIEGYEEEFLGDAFDYLVQSDTLAKAFMAKSQNLLKVGLERFKRQQ